MAKARRSTKNGGVANSATPISGLQEVTVSNLSIPPSFSVNDILDWYDLPLLVDIMTASKSPELYNVLTHNCPGFPLAVVVPSIRKDYLFTLQRGIFEPLSFVRNNAMGLTSKCGEQDSTNATNEVLQAYPLQDHEDIIHMAHWHIPYVVRYTMLQEGLIRDGGRFDNEYEAEYARRLRILQNVQNTVVIEYAALQSKVARWITEYQLDQADLQTPMVVVGAGNGRPVTNNGWLDVNAVAYWRQQLGWAGTSVSSQPEVVYTTKFIPEVNTPLSTKQRNIVYIWNRQVGKWTTLHTAEPTGRVRTATIKLYIERVICGLEATRRRSLKKHGMAYVLDLDEQGKIKTPEKSSRQYRGKKRTPSMRFGGPQFTPEDNTTDDNITHLNVKRSRATTQSQTIRRNTNMSIAQSQNHHTVLGDNHETQQHLASSSTARDTDPLSPEIPGTKNDQSINLSINSTNAILPYIRPRTILSQETISALEEEYPFLTQIRNRPSKLEWCHFLNWFNTNDDSAPGRRGGFTRCINTWFEQEGAILREALFLQKMIRILARARPVEDGSLNEHGERKYVWTD